MENTNEEKRYKIEKIESGIKNAALYEGAKTAMYIGLFAMACAVAIVLTQDYNMELFTKGGTTLEHAIGATLCATSWLSIIAICKRIVNLARLADLECNVKKRKKQGEGSLDFNELKFEEFNLFNMDDKDGILKNVILNGFFKEDKETISEGDTKKR